MRYDMSKHPQALNAAEQKAYANLIKEAKLHNPDFKTRNVFTYWGHLVEAHDYKKVEPKVIHTSIFDPELILDDTQYCCDYHEGVDNFDLH